jgi:hypothetical protein
VDEALEQPDALLDGIEWMRIWEPFLDDSARLIGQAGAFTRSRLGVSFLESLAQIGPLDRKLPVLQRFDVPESARDAALLDLTSMNVTALSLFPDLYGAARHANAQLSFPAIVQRNLERVMLEMNRTRDGRGFSDHAGRH